MSTINERIGWLEKELKKAYHVARAGKTSKPGVIEFDKIAKSEIATLAEEMYTRTYTPRPSTAFIVNQPVKREIFAAQFRDRVVHHFLFNQVNKWWDTRFIEDNYSCRVGKGTLYGIRRLDYHIRSVSRNYTKPAYILKLDLQGYFMSLDRKKLYQRAIWGLDRQFPYKGYQYQLCKYLWKVIIFNDSLKDVTFNCPRSAWKGLPPSKSLFHQKDGRGIAIGNLTSQLLSNMYLDQLDRFVTLELGFKHYGRYVDDFYIISSSKDELVKTTSVIEKYLKNNLVLTLHPHKRHLQECTRGVAFLGAVIYPFRIHPGKRLKSNLLAALVRPDCSPATEASYRGLVKHYKNKKLLNGIKIRGGYNKGVLCLA
ncbi:MAG: Reverse transcriptase protein [Patescibacteria group bacterium]|jgi:RNA-directed DNA polymerase|nr:Reverse transcriptase protein [Patescibacteria group bacterium]